MTNTTANYKEAFIRTSQHYRDSYGTGDNLKYTEYHICVPFIDVYNGKFDYSEKVIKDGTTIATTYSETHANAILSALKGN